MVIVGKLADIKADYERRTAIAVEAALKETDWSVKYAAEKLGVSTSHLQATLRRFPDIEERRLAHIEKCRQLGLLGLSIRKRLKAARARTAP